MADRYNDIHTILGADNVPVYKVVLYLPCNAALQARTTTSPQMPKDITADNDELHIELGSLVSQLRNLNDRLHARSKNRQSILDSHTSEFEDSMSMRDVDKAEVERYMKEIVVKLEESVKMKVSETIEQVETYEEERFAVRLKACRTEQLESIKRLRDVFVRMNVLDRKAYPPTPPQFDLENEVLWDLLQRHIISPLQQSLSTSKSTSSESDNIGEPNSSAMKANFKDVPISKAQSTGSLQSDSEYEPDSPFSKKSTFPAAVTMRAAYSIQTENEVSKGHTKQKSPPTTRLYASSPSRSSDDSEESEAAPLTANRRQSLRGSSTRATTPNSDVGKNTIPAPESKKRVWRESSSRCEVKKKKKLRTEFQRMVNMSKGGSASLE